MNVWNILKLPWSEHVLAQDSEIFRFLFLICRFRGFCGSLLPALERGKKKAKRKSEFWCQISKFRLNDSGSQVESHLKFHLIRRVSRQVEILRWWLETKQNKNACSVALHIETDSMLNGLLMWPQITHRFIKQRFSFKILALPYVTHSVASL